MISRDVKNKGTILEFNTQGNDKQKEVAKLWNDTVTRDIVYGGSKGCNISTTLIVEQGGYKQIKDVVIGDVVLTTNEKTQKGEWKKVLKTLKYHSGGICEYHKLITFVTKGGNIVSLTPNHELYIEGSWMPAGEFARRTLEGDIVSEWVHGVDTREDFVSPETWTDRFSYFDSYIDKTRLLHTKFSDRKEQKSDQKSKPISCHSFRPKPRKQGDGESRRLRQKKQLLRKSELDDSKRECNALLSSNADIEVARGKEPQGKIDKCSSIRNSEAICSENIHCENARAEVWSIREYNQGCIVRKELCGSEISEIRFELIQGYVYDLHVEDNHNYCITKEHIIAHNSGKSFLGASLIFGDAFTFPGTQYTIARKTLSDLRKYTMNSIDEVVDKTWKIPQSEYRYNHKDNAYYLRNGSTVFLTDAKYLPSDPQYSRFGGWQLTKAWVEECSEFEGSAIRNILASVGRWKNNDFNRPLKGKILQTCNPAKNYLYTDYYKPHKEGRLDPWKAFIQALPTDNHMLQEGYLAGLYESLDYNSRRRLLEGDWEYDDDPSVLIDYDKACDVFRNSSQGLITDFRGVTSDIARLGGDRIVIIQWEGFVGTIRSFERKLLTAVTAEIEKSRKIVGCMRDNVLVDADGLGSGVQDFGGFRGFRNNSRALPDPKNPRDHKGKIISENYDNLKSQCGFRMSERINNNGILLKCTPKEQELILEELEQVKQKEMDSDMKKGLVSKKDMKDNLGRSPDFWDAVLMREFFELKTPGAKVRYITGNENLNKPSGRDPYWYPEIYGN